MTPTTKIPPQMVRVLEQLRAECPQLQIRQQLSRRCLAKFTYGSRNYKVTLLRNDDFAVVRNDGMGQRMIDWLRALLNLDLAKAHRYGRKVSNCIYFSGQLNKWALENAEAASLDTELQATRQLVRKEKEALAELRKEKSEIDSQLQALLPQLDALRVETRRIGTESSTLSGALKEVLSALPARVPSGPRRR